MTSGREIEERVRAVLESTGVPFEIFEIDPDFADTAAFCQKYGYTLEESGNTIIVASKKEPKQYCACVVRASTRLDVNHAVADLMGIRKLSFATAEETIALTGMMIGGVTVFALPEDLPIYVDEGLMGLDSVILGSGSRSSKVKVSPEVFHRLPAAKVIAGLASEPPAS